MRRESRRAKAGGTMKFRRCFKIAGNEFLRLSGVLFLIGLALSIAAASQAEHRYWAADIHQQGIRFTSGLTVCDEVLWKGRWVNRYWLSTGFIEPEVHLGSAQERLQG